jgi:hypothetical protein
MPKENPHPIRATTVVSPTSIDLSANVPAELVVEPVLKPRVLFRVTSATSRHDREALLHSLTSNYELQQRPRKIERIYSVLHFAISMWTSADAALANALAWPKNGDHIARLHLLPGIGICVDRPPNESEHRSLWAAPDQVLRCVADVRKASDIENKPGYTRKQ